MMCAVIVTSTAAFCSHSVESCTSLVGLDDAVQGLVAERGDCAGDFGI